MDGQLGHGKHVHSRSNETIASTKRKDEWKECRAKINGFSVIRINANISSSDYMKDQIYFALSKYFNLDFIDWDMCNRYATKNLVKEVCDYYCKNTYLSTKDLAVIFSRDVSSIRSYLIRGAELGRCEYNSIDAKKSNYNNLAKKFGKKLQVFRNGFYLGTYYSIRDLIRCSLSDFGVQMLSTGISNAINGVTQQYKGFTIIHVNTN